jgi:transketolase
MRRSLAHSLQQLAVENPQMIFLTGDLGFNALESLQKVMGERFINCGVAEQNMLGLAAGMALEGHSVFCYSIAPFVTLRPLEQIRNDICFHKLPVHIIGNGGGYGYGIMGASHHALEDIALMRLMPSMQCYVPAFQEDVDVMLRKIIAGKQPSYLRLGLGKLAPATNTNQDLVCLNKAQRPLATLVACGPLVNNLLEHAGWKHLASFLDVFVLKRFPITSMNTLQESLSVSQKLITVEEHYSAGGLGEMISQWVLKERIYLKRAEFKFAVGYPSAEYGSQSFHQKQSGLDGDSLLTTINEVCTA